MGEEDLLLFVLAGPKLLRTVGTAPVNWKKVNFWKVIQTFYRKCIRTGTAGVRTCRLLGHHLLQPQNFDSSIFIKSFCVKEFFRTCNVLPFSCTHLALWSLQRQGKRPKVHAKQKGFKNFFSRSSLYFSNKLCLLGNNCPF